MWPQNIVDLQYQIRLESVQVVKDLGHLWLGYNYKEVTKSRDTSKQVFPLQILIGYFTREWSECKDVGINSRIYEMILPWAHWYRKYPRNFLNSQIFWTILSLHVHIARWAHMGHLPSLCPSVHPNWKWLDLLGGLGSWYPATRNVPSWNSRALQLWGLCHWKRDPHMVRWPT